MTREVGVLNYTADEFDTKLINDLWRRVQEELQVIQGTSGTWNRERFDWGDDFIRYVDTNGTILHGFGNITTAST